MAANERTDDLVSIIEAHIACCEARAVELRKEADETANPDIAREIRREAVAWEVAAYDMNERLKTV